MDTASTTIISNDDEQDLFVTNETYNTLDQYIDDAQMQSDKIFSIVNLVGGQPHKKKQKIEDLKPIVFARLNSGMGKAKPVTLIFSCALSCVSCVSNSDGSVNCEKSINSRGYSAWLSSIKSASIPCRGGKRPSAMVDFRGNANSSKNHHIFAGS
jgi:hypothetical protein